VVADRKLFLLPTHASSADLLSPLRKSGWCVQLARHVGQAIAVSDIAGCDVELVVFSAVDRTAIARLEQMTASYLLVWIAVVKPGVLQDAAVARLIHQRFYDFRTLPLDITCPRIVLGGLLQWCSLAIRCATRTARPDPPA